MLRTEQRAEERAELRTGLPQVPHIEQLLASVEQGCFEHRTVERGCFEHHTVERGCFEHRIELEPGPRTEI